MLNKITKNYRPVEPFVVGEQIDIKTKKQALEVINKNLYYIYVLSGLFLFIFSFALYNAYINNVYPNPSGLIIGGMFLSVSFFIKKYISRIASIILIILTSLVILLFILYSITHSIAQGLIFFFALIFIASSLRIRKAIFIYHKLDIKT